MQEYLIRFDTAPSKSLTYLVLAVCVEQAAIIAWDEQKNVFGGPDTKPDDTVVVSLPLEINDHVIHVCASVLDDNGITVTRDQIVEMIKANDGLRQALFTYYAEYQCDGMDTADRDYLLDAFANTILGGQRWPCHMHTGTDLQKNFATAMLAKTEDKTIGLAQEMVNAMKAIIA